VWSQAAAPLPPDANYGQRVADALGREVQDHVANGVTHITRFVRFDEAGVTCDVRGCDTPHSSLIGIAVSHPGDVTTNAQVIRALRESGATGMRCQPETLTTTVCTAARPDVRVELRGTDVGSG